MNTSISYFLKKQDFLKAVQHRVRLGASHYLQFFFPVEKFDSVSKKMETTFLLKQNSAQRNRQKNLKLRPVADCFYFLQGDSVHLIILFTLPTPFVESPNFKTTFPEQAQFLNETYGLTRRENFFSIYDKKNRLTITSSGYPVYILNCLELPERLARKGSSHQWVWRLHSTFRKGKIEKMVGLLEKARNLPKPVSLVQRDLLFSKLDSELFLLNTLCPFWGVQDDISAIRRKIRKKALDSSLAYQVDLFHPTYKSFYISKVPEKLFLKKVKASSNG